MSKATTNAHINEEVYRRRTISPALALVGPIFLLLAAMALSAGGSRLLAARASAHWPATAGVIIESRAGLNCTFCRPTINYHYDVNGRSFVGSNITAGPQDYYKHFAADEKVRAYPVGRNLTVYYNLTDPAISCLEPGVLRWCAYLYLASAGGLMMVVLFLFWRLYRNKSIFS